MATPITTIPNRPAGKPVFDFQIANGALCRVALSTVSNDGQSLVVSSSVHQIDSSGNPVLDPSTGSPIRIPDQTHTVYLSNVIAGTSSLYDAWCKYSGAVDPAALLTDWTSGSGSPTGTPVYGAGYYDTAAQKPWMYQQGLLNAIGQDRADCLSNAIEMQAALAGIGL